MAEPLTVDAIRNCLEGAIPAVIATCAADGTPNVAYLSQVEYVDGQHVALSYQFFNKTRQNVLANPRARLLVVDPVTVATYRVAIEYLRTETGGPLFERMKAKLAGIASHTGMSGVFSLKGSDIYRVCAIEAVAGNPLPAPAARRNLLASLRAAGARLGECRDLESLIEAALDGLQQEFAIEHAMVLLLDEAGARLYTVASRGYPTSGVGSEIAPGEGVIGVAARERTPIRIGHMTSEYGYGRAQRAAAEAGGLGAQLDTEIPLPGLPESRSQMAVPITAQRRLLGVLYVESPQDLRFGYDDEDALVALAGQLGAAMRSLPTPEDEPVPPAPRPAACPGDRLEVRHYAENHSVFLGGQYLIKGVAGSILWTLLQDVESGRRVEFTNRELRVDPRIGLPEIVDNLEARLILLQRRLAEQGACIQLVKTGRGRFRLDVARPLQLVDIQA